MSLAFEMPVHVPAAITRGDADARGQVIDLPMG
jgi:hypothetical protein